MTNLFIVTSTTGGMYPSVNLKTLTNHSEALAEFDELKREVGDDPTEVSLYQVDLATGQERCLESWTGTLEDYEEEFDARMQENEAV